MPMTAIPSHILVSSSDVVVNQRPGAKEGSLNLKENQVIKARVLSIVSSRQAYLLIQGKKMLAKVYVPLKEGANLVLKVSRAGPQQLFKLMEIKEEGQLHRYVELFKAIGRAEPYRNLTELLADKGVPGGKNLDARQKAVLESLGQRAEALSLKSPVADQRFLKSIIKDSGLTWEHKLLSALLPQRALSKENVGTLIHRDLKALAMRFLEDPNQAGDSAGQRIKAFVDGLEKLQLLNRYTSEESGKFLLPLPVLFNETLKFGQMLIDLGRDGSDAGGEKDRNSRLIRVSFLLEMSNLGDIQADFSIFKNVISGSFGVTNNDIRAFVEKNVADLIKKFNNHGFEVRDICCCLISPEVLSSTSLFDKLVDADEGMLHLII